jgi:hypothetical protein
MSASFERLSLVMYMGMQEKSWRYVVYDIDVGLRYIGKHNSLE